MTYQSRILADPDYLRALGQAFYNFTYLEWVVICTIVRLSPDGFDSVPRGEPAAEIAKAFTKAINQASSSLPNDLRVRLVKFDEAYREAYKKRRNKLLHAHPYTDPDGEQRLMGGELKWPFEAVDDAAKFFEDAAIMGNEFFHGDLTRYSSSYRQA